jgi:hypothetical protein
MATSQRRNAIALPVAAVTLSLAAAAVLRYAAIEPAGLAHLCGAPAAPWWCAPRALAAVVLDVGALGFVAIATGVVAILTRSSTWALAAACLGAAGLLLYAVATGAVGFLLGFLVLARAIAADRHPPDAGREREA